MARGLTSHSKRFKKLEGGNTKNMFQFSSRTDESSVKLETVMSINVVAVYGAWAPVGAGEISTDSASEESVCLEPCGKAHPRRSHLGGFVSPTPVVGR